MNEADKRVIDRFVEAVTTGEPCKTSYTGIRRNYALGLGGLGVLKKHGLLREAFLAIANLKADLKAQARFLDSWSRVPLGYFIRPDIGNDDVFFGGLRVLLPPYEGSPVQLFRGQLDGEPVGASWTRSQHIALKFALFGTANVDALQLHLAKYKPASNGVILTAELHREIICAPCLFGYPEGEYVVDPRGIIPRRAPAVMPQR